MTKSRKSTCPPKVKIVLERDSDPPVNRLMLQRLEIAANIMARKNTDRGDCWKATGVMGAFLEIHTCFSRLREMVWNRPMMLKKLNWKKEIFNVLGDMRNFTILLEMAVLSNLPHGRDYEEAALLCPNCSEPIKVGSRYMNSVLLARRRKCGKA